MVQLLRCFDVLSYRRDESEFELDSCIYIYIHNICIYIYIFLRTHTYIYINVCFQIVQLWNYVYIYSDIEVLWFAYMFHVYNPQSISPMFCCLFFPLTWCMERDVPRESPSHFQCFFVLVFFCSEKKVLPLQLVREFASISQITSLQHGDRWFNCCWTNVRISKPKRSL